MTRRHRRRSWPWVLLFGGILLLAVFYVGGGWFFSGQVHDDALASDPYDPSRLQEGAVAALAVDDGGGATVTLTPDAQWAGDTSYDDSTVGITVGETLLVVGPEGADGQRRVLDLQGELPDAGDRYGLARDVWLSAEQAGLSANDVTLRTLDGQRFPSWVIRDKGSTKWAVLVHGKNAARSEMLRLARPLHAAGYNVIIPTYTGDVGAPPSDDGMVHYGRTEWTDIEAAVQYAVDQEATKIVLGGASHGGAVALGLLAHSTLSRRIDGLILDSPASSLRDVIDEAAESRTLPVVGLPIPESLEDVAAWITSARYQVSFSAIDYTDMKGLVDVPLLTFQGADDTTVPQAVNDRFMREGAGQGGTYKVVPGAGHVQSWNVDPERYEDTVTAFVDKLGD